MGKVSRGAAILASAAAFSLMATPALARPGWGGGGWGRHHDRIDGDDILTGILILGGIAVLAGAASNAAKSAPRQTSYPVRNREETRDYRGYGDDNRPVWNQGGGINSAVNTCLDEIDRGRARVDSVDGVVRDGAGWRVTGRTDGSGSFACTVGADGRIVNVNVNGQAI